MPSCLHDPTTGPNLATFYSLSLALKRPRCTPQHIYASHCDDFPGSLDPWPATSSINWAWRRPIGVRTDSGPVALRQPCLSYGWLQRWGCGLF
jgi:hypothetical protein